MKFGLMFFASSEDALVGEKYRLVKDSARFADSHGFSSVWVPERHFTEFGSLYPNPAVLHAALATITERVRLQAGSVVVPLHNPMRIAEEWSMVDNLSNGRIGISFAPGWNPADFAFCPEKYESRQEELLAGIHAVRHLWRGGTVEAIAGTGDPVELRIYPTPVQRELPIWLTAAGTPSTFARAGEMGANLLTHLLDQDEERLAHKIALYRQARSDNGHNPSTATVTVMLHTFVGSDADLVREQARAPFCQYVRSNLGLLNGLARSRGMGIEIDSLPARELDEFVQLLYERFASSRGLIGTPETCMDLVFRLETMGVNEIACLLDFGPPADLILENLPHLLRLKTTYDAANAPTRARRTPFDLAAVQRRCSERISGEDFNCRMREHGIELDDEFKSIERIWRGSGEALGEIRIDRAAENYEIHPAVLDACSRVLGAAIDDEDARGGCYLPSAIEALHVHGPLETNAWSHARLRKVADPDAIEGDVRIYSTGGRPLIEVEGMKLRRVRSEQPNHGQLLYQLKWRPSQTNRRPESALAGEWLILADCGGVAERLAGLLEEAGNACTLLGAECQVDEMIARHWCGILHLWSLDLSPGDVEGRRRVVASLLQIAQSDVSSPFWLVTSRAMPVLDGEAPAVAQSPVWGLGRAIAAEQSRHWRGLIDLDEDRAAGDLISAVGATDREDMIAYRNGLRYVARLVRQESFNSIPVQFDKNTTILITGGLGGLGLQLASWLARKGVGNLALLARSAPSPAALEELRQIEAGQTTVRVILADVTRREAVAQAVAEIGLLMPPLKGVFHLAGTLDDALLAEQDTDRFERSAAAKIEGAWNLHELLGEAQLDHFVLFSSLAALVAVPGQASYAAANSFLDALAHLRRAYGKPALSINWGPWAQIGHANTAYGRTAHARLARLGVDSLPPDLGIIVLEQLMGQRATQVAVARIDWPQLLQVDPAAAETPLLRELVQSRTEAVQGDSELVARLKTCAPHERRDFLMSRLAVAIAEVLRLRTADLVAPGQSLFDYGLDSILALELTSRISSAFGRALRPTVFFTHPTLESLADHLLDEVSLSAAIASKPEALTEDELAELILEEIGRR
jgi:natural product biosynthesis luciferase-like monooxygenase protein